MSIGRRSRCSRQRPSRRYIRGRISFRKSRWPAWLWTSSSQFAAFYIRVGWFLDLPQTHSPPEFLPQQVGVAFRTSVAIVAEFDVAFEVREILTCKYILMGGSWMLVVNELVLKLCLSYITRTLKRKGGKAICSSLLGVPIILPSNRERTVSINTATATDITC